MSKSLILAAVVSVALASAVTTLTPDNFDTVVGGSKAVLVKFFAPWCGHCKALAPEYEKAAEAFVGNKKVVLAEVDCDANGGLCSRYSVQGYPTVKYFKAGDKTGENFEGQRKTDDIISWVEGKAGTRRVGAKTNVVSLTAADFDKVVKDPSKDVFIKFFAPWCGHCKALAPVYEQVAGIYAAEENLVIAEVNCDAEKDLCSKYDVHGFPTLKFFPKSNKAGTPYSGGRDLDAFVEFFTSNLGLQRTATGRLNYKAGRIGALDVIAAKFLAASDKATLLAEAKNAAAAVAPADAKNAALYVKTFENIVAKGNEYIAAEKARIQKTIDSGKISLKKIDEFTVRTNILNAF